MLEAHTRCASRRPAGSASDPRGWARAAGVPVHWALCEPGRGASSAGLWGGSGDDGPAVAGSRTGGADGGRGGGGAAAGSATPAPPLSTAAAAAAAATAAATAASTTTAAAPPPPPGSPTYPQSVIAAARQRLASSSGTPSGIRRTIERMQQNVAEEPPRPHPVLQQQQVQEPRAEPTP